MTDNTSPQIEQKTSQAVTPDATVVFQCDGPGCRRELRATSSGPVECDCGQATYSVFVSVTGTITRDKTPDEIAAEQKALEGAGSAADDDKPFQ